MARQLCTHSIYLLQVGGVQRLEVGVQRLEVGVQRLEVGVNRVEVGVHRVENSQSELIQDSKDSKRQDALEKLRRAPEAKLDSNVQPLDEDGDRKSVV